jgi:hypothetical protein
VTDWDRKAERRKGFLKRKKAKRNSREKKIKKRKKEEFKYETKKLEDILERENAD